MCPDVLAYITGSIGLLGARPSYEMLMDCDTVAELQLKGVFRRK